MDLVFQFQTTGLHSGQLGLQNQLLPLGIWKQDILKQFLGMTRNFKSSQPGIHMIICMYCNSFCFCSNAVMQDSAALKDCTLTIKPQSYRMATAFPFVYYNGYCTYTTLISITTFKNDQKSKYISDLRTRIWPCRLLPPDFRTLAALVRPSWNSDLRWISRWIQSGIG